MLIGGRRTERQSTFKFLSVKHFHEKLVGSCYKVDFAWLGCVRVIIIFSSMLDNGLLFEFLWVLPEIPMWPLDIIAA